MLSTDEGFDPKLFDLGPQRQAIPLSSEIPEWFYGYYKLEQAERYATSQAIQLHRLEVLGWYRILNCYYRALDLPSIHSDDEMWITIWKIFRLGICAAKSALDASLAGYYVGAFGSIRQMTEYFFGINHLVQNPDTVARYYLTDEGVKPQRLPSAGQRIAEVVAAVQPGGPFENADFHVLAELVRKTYRRMSDGHHLDGLALVQTGNQEDEGYYLGAGYHPSLLREALYHGTFVTGMLAQGAAEYLADRNPNAPQILAEIKAALDSVVASETEQEREPELWLGEDVSEHGEVG